MIKPPNPKRALGLLQQLLASAPVQRVRWLFEDVAYFLSRPIVGIGERLRKAWAAMPVIARRRVIAVVSVVGAAVVVNYIVLPVAPCQLPGGDRCQPSDDAIGLVDHGALAYVHVNFDSDTDQIERANKLAEKLPLLASGVLADLPAPPGDGLNFRRDVVPFAEGEVALVVLPAGRKRTQSAFLIESNDDELAAKFARRAVGGSKDEYAGVDLRVSPEQSAAIVDGFLVIGANAAVRSAIDIAAGDGDSLADDPVAEAVLDRLPDKRLIEGFLSRDAAADQLDAVGLGAAAALVNPDATDGAAFSIGIGEDGEALEVAVRSNLEPDLAERTPGLVGSFVPFEPRLHKQLGADSIIYVAAGDPAASLTTLLAQAVSDAPGLLEGVSGLERTLRRSGVNLERDVLPLVDSETALMLTPPPDAGDGDGDGFGIIEPGVQPVVSVVADGAGDDDREGLARLQGAIAAAVDPRGGQAAVFSDTEIAGVEAQSLRLTAAIDLSFAIARGRLAIATASDGIARIFGSKPIADVEAFSRATEDFSDDLSLLIYVDLSRGVELYSELVAAEDPAFALVAGDLRRLDALGLAVTSSTEAIDTDLRLVVDADGGSDSGLDGPVPGD